MSKRDFPPVHPGEILREEFLLPLGISQYRLAKEIHVPARRINCLLYTSDAADDLLCVDLGGRRILKKKKT